MTFALRRAAALASGRSDSAAARAGNQDPGTLEQACSGDRLLAEVDIALPQQAQPAVDIFVSYLTVQDCFPTVTTGEPSTLGRWGSGGSLMTYGASSIAMEIDTPRSQEQQRIAQLEESIELLLSFTSWLMDSSSKALCMAEENSRQLDQLSWALASLAVQQMDTT